MLSNIVSRLAYAALAGIVAFLIVLGIGLIIVHFLDGSYGNRVQDFSVIIGLLMAVIYFFSRPSTPII